MTDARKGRNKLISECPVCSAELVVSHLKCNDCGTELTGEFTANEFARLPEDKLEFLRVFLSCRGNLKEVEGVLRLSYPTIRARLDSLLDALALKAGEGVATAAATDERAEILAALERGEIAVEEAESRLRSLR